MKITLKDGSVKEYGEAKTGLRVIRHTSSHVWAQAMIRLFPDAKITIGPAIDEGFYYDFDAEPFSREDLDKLEAEMKKIIKEGHELRRFQQGAPAENLWYCF